RVAIDLMVLSVVPNTARELPWEQWRNSFGTIDSNLPAVLNQIRGLGRVVVRTRSQLQAVSGTWTELECSARSLGQKGETADTDDTPNHEAMSASPTAVTKLRIRPSTQSEGGIRIELHAQSSHVEDRTQIERPQLVTVRFNTEVVLHEGSTGV